MLKQSLRLACFGLAFGGAIAAAGLTLFAARIMLVDSFDVAAYLGAILVVLASCLTAAAVPARRAARIEPMVMLRHD
jgi:ABC-type antimicrobial peptide transport system permease subunit